MTQILMITEVSSNHEPKLSSARRKVPLPRKPSSTATHRKLPLLVELQAQNRVEALIRRKSKDYLKRVLTKKEGAAQNARYLAKLQSKVLKLKDRFNQKSYEYGRLAREKSKVVVSRSTSALRPQEDKEASCSLKDLQANHQSSKFELTILVQMLAQRKSELQVYRRLFQQSAKLKKKLNNRLSCDRQLSRSYDQKMRAQCRGDEGEKKRELGERLQGLKLKCQEMVWLRKVQQLQKQHAAVTSDSSLKQKTRSRKSLKPESEHYLKLGAKRNEEYEQLSQRLSQLKDKLASLRVDSFAKLAQVNEYYDQSLLKSKASEKQQLGEKEALESRLARARREKEGRLLRGEDQRLDEVRLQKQLNIEEERKTELARRAEMRFETSIYFKQVVARLLSARMLELVPSEQSQLREYLKSLVH